MAERNTLARGQQAERQAESYLAERGLRPVARNYRCRLGEIDLIMRDGECLVFVEVRYRRRGRCDNAALTVDSRKQARLCKTAGMYLARARYSEPPVLRFDVVGIDQDQRSRLRFNWIKDAFRPG